MDNGWVNNGWNDEWVDKLWMGRLMEEGWISGSMDVCGWWMDE